MDCVVCFEPFGVSAARTPRVLNCGHTFCHTCLSMLAIEQGFILCPNDREQTPCCSVDGLKKNFTLLDILEQSSDLAKSQAAQKVIQEKEKKKELSKNLERDERKKVRPETYLDSLVWVTCTKGGYPDNAFHTGAQEGGRSLFVVRANHKNIKTPGKLVQGFDHAHVSWGGKEHAKKEYQVLCNHQNLTWLPGHGRNIPPNAIPLGTENGVYQTKEQTYLYSIKGQVVGCRGPVDVLGKYHGKYKTGYLPYGGKEHEVESGFYVLCWQDATAAKY